MKKLTKSIAFALGIAHALTESYMLVYQIWKGSATTKANLFLDKSAIPEGIVVSWYIKFMTTDILWVVTYMAFARVAYHYSRKLFLVVGTFTLYHLLDFIMFMVNYKQSGWLYLTLLGLNILAVVILFIPLKERAKVVSME